MSFLRHIQRCNNYRPQEFVPLRVDGEPAGRVRPAFARELLRYGEVFGGDAGEGLDLLPVAADRTDAVASVVADLARRDMVQPPLGEWYPVTRGSRDDVLFLVDRSMASWFGFRTFGQHLNGFLRRGDEVLMWIGRRARDRRLFPGRLDQLVAGGLPHGVSLEDNLAKECYEEAGIGPELAAQAVYTGSVTYFAQTEKGAKPDELFCYDLELDDEFEPRCTDGEVEAFQLMPVDEVMEIVRTSDAFKPNCSLVVLDFLLRHGVLGPDDPDYEGVRRGLRAPLDESREFSATR